jgi:enoyl-CoA hydratase
VAQPARIRYTKSRRVATLALESPRDLNALHPQTLAELSRHFDRIEQDDEIRVVVLEGHGETFSSGYSFRDWSDRFEMTSRVARWDPIKDYRAMSHNVRQFMRLWRCVKPVIVKVRGWCVGGATDLALCGDIIVAATDAWFGYPPARIWGTPTTALWVYRLGLEHAKRYLLCGEPIAARRAYEIGLVSEIHAPARLDGAVTHLSRKLATIPSNQMAMNKLLLNQAFENMGLATTQLIGTLFDGIARHTPQAARWERTLMTEGVKQALAARDRPFGDYSVRRRPRRGRDRGASPSP